MDEYNDDDWSDWVEPDRLPDVIQRKVCGGRAWDLGDTIDRENCGEIPSP